jgi:hypothetical protein
MLKTQREEKSYMGNEHFILVQKNNDHMIENYDYSSKNNNSI